MPGPRAARVAVSILFAANGALYANLLPRLPAIKADLDLSNAALGAALAATAIGALISGAFAGALVARVGSGRLAAACAVASGAVLVGAGLAPTWAALAGALLLVGASDSVMDVAMNAHGLRVQRLYGRSIINSFHAWWSIGAALGGATGAVAAAARVPVAVHLLAAGVAIAVVVLTIVRLLLPGADHADAGQPQRRPEARLVVRALGFLAVVTLLAAAVEDVPYSWSAVYLQEAVGAAPGVAGLGLVAFTAAMTLGRLVADRLVTRLGDVAVTRTGAGIAAAGIIGAVVVGTVPAAVVGFALAGLGAAPVYPALFHAAGNRPGVRAGDGIAFVSWTGRVGFLLAPLLVGVIADAAGIALGITVAAVAAACVALLSGALRPARDRPAA